MNNRVDHGFSKRSKNSNRWRKQFFSLLAFGVISLMFVSKLPDVKLGFTVFFSVLLMTMITNFISEYSNILLESKDNAVLFHQPISSKTIFTGRLIYIIAIAIACGLVMSIPSLVYILATYGLILGCSFLLSCFLITFLSVFISLFLYLVIMKRLGGERFKDVINYIQIGFSLLFLGGYYYSIELWDIKDLADFTFTYQWWAVFVPPIWQVSLMDMFQGVFISNFNILLSVLAIVCPLILGYYTYNYLSKGFKSDLLKFDSKDIKKEEKKVRFSISNIYARLFSVNKQEQTLFTVYKTLLSRDRNFKMMVYPAIAYSVLLPLFKIIKSYSQDGVLNIDSSPSIYLYALYFMSMLFVTSITCVHIGDFKNLTDIYRVAPIKKSGVILTSVLKVLSYKFLVLPLVFVSVFIFYFWGLTHLLSIVTVFFIVSLLGILMLISGNFNLPLSISKADSNKTSMGVKMFLFMLILGVLGMIHYFILLVPYGLLIYTIILGAGYFASMRALREKQLK